MLKNTRFFYALLGGLFIFFVIGILITGRFVYKTQETKLFESKHKELLLTLESFENRLDEVEIEIRRIVNILRHQGLTENPTEKDIRTLLSDVLFDHHFLRIIMLDETGRSVMEFKSRTVYEDYNDFMSMPADDILKNMSINKQSINNISISPELNTVFLVKKLTNELGNSSSKLVFFFSPKLLLKYLPNNYAFLLKGEGIKWVPDSSLFPADFEMPSRMSSSGHIHINLHNTVFYSELSGGNGRYFLAANADTSELRINLLFSTFLIVFIFGIFFVVIMLTIYFRNIQIAQLISTQKATVVCLANLAEFKDNETADHLERTRHYGTLLAKEMKLKPKYKKKMNNEFMDNIGFASVLHDIGKVGVPDDILKKPGKLTTEEFEVIKQHTVFAREILKELLDKHSVNDIFFNLSYNIASYHHERWDGKGYPEGLCREEIPLEARIFALCDVYDALRSKRVYKEPFSHEKAVRIINSESGRQFDPDIVAVFNQCSDNFNHIHDTYEMLYSEISYISLGSNKRDLKVEWHTGISVGIEDIDNDHKVLLGRINFLIKSIMDGRANDSILEIMNFLGSYSEEHFKREEDLMEAIDHPDLEMHREAHAEFRKNLLAVIDDINSDGIREGTLYTVEKDLIAWLLDHIKTMDQRIKSVEA